MLTEGMFIADRYEIVSKVGAGGMSDVYKAKDHILSRFVAIKVLKQEYSEDRTFVSKFRTEAQSAAGLEHPNIVNIYDVGSEDGLHFIVMEYVEGITLKTYIEKKGQLSFKESVSIAIQVARGIEAAHNKDIIHRDIKPQNIIISTEGKVKVTDFGIARAASSNTISSDVMGSVHYASPEQARNGFVDGRSDIYSLGIVMYEMITGRVPFDGDTTVAVAIQHLQEEMTSPRTYAPNVPISFEKIILKCTQKNADRRYQAISELISDLRKSLANPNDDFVEIAPLVDNAKTKIISSDEIKQIKDRGAAEPAPSPEIPKMVKKKEVVPEEYEDEDDEDDEDEDDSGFLNPKMDKAVTIMGIATAVIIVIFIIYLLGAVTGLWRFGAGSKDNSESQQTQSSETETQDKKETETTADEKVEMISVLYKSYDDAKAALEKIGLEIFIIKKEESTYEDGTVLSQDITVGTKVSKGTTVNVVVAGTDESTSTKVDVPNVVGRTENDAVNLLKNAGLEFRKTYEYSDSVDAGTVISQNPGKNESVEEGTTVTIVISQGQESVEVPNVINLTQKEGQKELANAGLKYAVNTEYSDTVEEGYIIKQSVDAGKKVAKGKTITITVSLGKKTAYYKTRVTKTYDGEYQVVSYTFKLVGSNGTQYASGANTGNSVTVTASDMTCSSGTLTVIWTYQITNEDGTVTEATEERSYDVQFTEQ